jgi:hypothetical protein
VRVYKTIEPVDFSQADLMMSKPAVAAVVPRDVRALQPKTLQSFSTAHSFEQGVRYRVIAPQCDTMQKILRMTHEFVRIHLRGVLVFGE